MKGISYVLGGFCLMAIMNWALYLGTGALKANSLSAGQCAPHSLLLFSGEVCNRK